MSLPKLNVPVYETVLPSTEKVIKYRPFLVKEEKVLLTAMEDGKTETIMNAVKQVLKNCIQSKIDLDKLPTFDLEFLFLRLRAKSVGEEVTIGLKPWGCPQNNGELCDKTTEVKVNLEEVKVIKDEKHSSKIMLDDNVGIKMRYPDISKINMDTGNDMETGMKMIHQSIDMIFTSEETHERDTISEKELEDFIDSLNTEQFAKIRTFFDTMPQLKHTAKYTCSTCGEEKETTITGLNSFFG